jgi:membrane associated rhomboid family serine protease
MGVEELLLGIGLSSAVVAGLIAIRTTADRRTASAPMLTLSCFVMIGAFSLAQLIVTPSLLPSMRDAALVRSGQLWRLVTSLLVQDGGWSGAVFNLVELLAIGAVAERMLAGSSGE